MDYIGSKEKLNEWIFTSITNLININDQVFLDACAGSGSVTKYASTLTFKKVISNDILEFSSHIVRGAISLPINKYNLCTEVIQEMNSLSGVEGFFYQNYSESAGRPYFSNENAAKIDACRLLINNYSNNIYVKSYLLLCLLEALSAVSNTTGIQAAFLKKIKKRAIQPLKIKPYNSLHISNILKIYNKNIIDLLKLKNRPFKENILYIDPPYNQRQYGPNYHLYETLVKDDNPIIKGKTGLRDWKNESKSDFCSRNSCLSFIKEIIKYTTAGNIFISYSSDGLISLKDLKKEINIQQIFKKDQKRYKSDISNNREYDNSKLEEFLIYIKK